MANPLLLDIALFLKSKSLVSGDGIDTFRDIFPEEPDNIVVLYEYAGSPAFLQDSAVHRSVQISARNSDADAARQKIVSIFTAFQTAQKTDGRVDLTSKRWAQVYLRQPPFLLRRDENNRTIYVFNIGVTTTID